MAEDFFGNLSKTLKKTVDTVGKKTDEFVEIQKIRTRQHALEDQIEKDAAFCMRCGAAMPEKEEEPEDAEFVHVEPEEKAEETEAAAPEEEPEEEPEKEAEVPEEE